MGSNIMKFELMSRVFTRGFPLPERKDIRCLADLASKEPSCKAVLDMPFAYYFLWVYPFGSPGACFKDGLSAEESMIQYREVYDLTTYLLETYRGSGKTFFLGHWEGDWYLHPNSNRKHVPTPEAIKGITDWLKIRQKAVDDAKKKTPPKGVNVFHYTEICLVQKGMRGEKCMINNVIPHVNVDFVSYSSYDTTIKFRDNVDKPLRETLNYIESKLPPKPEIKGKRVFIGEYGYPLEMTKTPLKQDAYSRQVCLTALSWGCPFVLYWEFYCNENKKGPHRGFWLIDNKNRKQPFYYTLQNYYAGAKRRVADFRKRRGRYPTPDEFRRIGVEALKAAPNKPAPRKPMRPTKTK